MVEAFAELLGDCCLNGLACFAVDHLRHGQSTHGLDRGAPPPSLLKRKHGATVSTGEEYVRAEAHAGAFDDRRLDLVRPRWSNHCNVASSGDQLAGDSDRLLLLSAWSGLRAHFEMRRRQCPPLINKGGTINLNPRHLD